MGDPTLIGAEMGHLPPQVQQRLQQDCEQHPGVRLGDCRQCQQEERAEAQRQEREDVLAEADKARDRFPLRFRQAAVDHPEVLAWAARFQADPKETRSLLLLGPTGTGKTWAAYGAAASAVRVAWPTRPGGYRMPRWQALTHADLCASLRPHGRDHDPESELKRYRELDLLMVDDLGAAKVTEFVEEATYRLINGRYEDMRPSIFTSNLQVGDLREAVGDRIASRLSEMCVRVVLDGPDRRRGTREAA